MGPQVCRLADAVSDTEQLRRFRSGFYRCLTGWADAAFELTDAALCAPAPVSSIPTLSLEPSFRRSHGSLYKALARGQVDAGAMRELLVRHRSRKWPLVFAVDASTWARCDAETSPERGFYYSASKHSAGKPIVAGWSYSWITALDWAHDSWTADARPPDPPPRADAVDVTATQVRDLVGRLGDTESPPLFCFDAGYDAIALTDTLSDVAADIVVRIRDDRVITSTPTPRHRRPARSGGPDATATGSGSPIPTPGPPPDVESTTTDLRYGTVKVSAWHGLHPRLGCRGHWAEHDIPPIVAGTLIRVEVEHLPKPTSATKKTLWLWAAGPGFNLDTCWRGYLRRFDIEHTFRFLKNTLGWTTPALRTPNKPTAGRG